MNYNEQLTTYFTDAAPLRGRQVSMQDWIIWITPTDRAFFIETSSPLPVQATHVLVTRRDGKCSIVFGQCEALRR